MPRDEEQSLPHKSYRGKDYEPIPLAITPERASARLTSPARSEASYDEGVGDPPRKNSSIRYTSPNNTQISRTTGMEMNTPTRRQTGPRDGNEGGRQTGANEGIRQTGGNAGRQTGGAGLSRREGGNAYAAGRQTTKNMPAATTREYSRVPNKTRDIPRNAPSGRTRELPPPAPKKRVHWFLPVGIGMLAMLALYLLGSNVVGWGMQIYNEVHYGTPRTFQMDAQVGHNDSKAHPSHFIAINLNRQAIVIEMMGGDPQKAITYVVPGTIAGDGGDKVPVTVDFRDVTNDHKPDMIVHIHLPAQDEVSIFINDGTKFRPSTNNDKISL